MCFNILSLDGGGVRGAFTAAYLAKLEELHGKPIYKSFDLIAGTSTGAFIALALALGEPATSIVDFYREWGGKVFQRTWYGKLVSPVRPLRDLHWFIQPKYSPLTLQRALTKVFGQKTLHDARRRLLVPSVNLTKGQVIVFKSRHLPRLTRDSKLKATDVALAASAAPTYFPHATISNGSAYCDGGIWANNPAVAAYCEAIKISESCRRPEIDPLFHATDIKILSIGTGQHHYFLRPSIRFAGLVYWGRRIIELIWASQSQGVHFESTYLLGEDRYTRVNFDIPDKTWALDYTGVISQLIHIGEEKAHETSSVILSKHLSTESADFVPFS